MSQEHILPPWSDLPPELLVLVFLRLPRRADRAFFAAVCHTWCSAARQCRLPPPTPAPWLVVPGGSITSFPCGETFQLPDGVRYHTSCDEWLFLSRKEDNSCFLMNPFTKATMPLPSLSSYSYYEEPVEVDEDHNATAFKFMWMDIKDNDNVSVFSLVLCSRGLIAAIVAVGDLGTIALCRPGSSAWSVSAHEGCRCLTTMVLFQGKLYALEDNNGREDLIAIDILDEQGSDRARVSRIEHLIEGISSSGIRLYLLESHGSLLMVHIEAPYETEHLPGPVDKIITAVDCCDFQVFEADFEYHLWAEVRTLGNDQPIALFLGQSSYRGRGCSRAVRVSSYDLSRDCIFFVDDETRRRTNCCVYDMKDRKFYSALPMVSWKEGDIPATWLFSQESTASGLQVTGEHLQQQELVGSGKDDRKTASSSGASTTLC